MQQVCRTPRLRNRTLCIRALASKSTTELTWPMMLDQLSRRNDAVCICPQDHGDSSRVNPILAHMGQSPSSCFPNRP